jgi:hypothetical protein
MSAKGGLWKDRPEAQAIRQFPRALRLTRSPTQWVSPLPFFRPDPQEGTAFTPPEELLQRDLIVEMDINSNGCRRVSTEVVDMLWN